MLHAQTIAALYRLLTTVYRSLPMYLADAAPWAARNDQRMVEALRFIVDDQKATSVRIAELLQQNQVPVETGDYPMGFTDLHDLSIEYLVKRLIACGRLDIVTIERLLPQMAADPAALALGEEALGAAKAHFDTLQGLAVEPGKKVPAA